jgi:hypothetical protein
MSKGGYYPHAERWGRKSCWNDSVTKAIRVPESIAEQVLEIAHKLDNGIDLNSAIKANDIEIERVKTTLQEALKLKPNAGRAIKAEIKKVLELLGDRPASLTSQTPVDGGDR